MGVIHQVNGSRGPAYFGLPMLYGIAWLVCAFVALDLTQGADGIAAVWPSSGIFVAALLHFGPRRRAMTAGWIAAASMAANLWAGSGFFATVGYTIANLLEGYLVFALMGGRARTNMMLSKPWNMARFGAAAIFAGSFSALMAGVLSGNLTLAFLSSWMSTVTLGMLIVTPVILFVAQDPQGHRNLVSLRALWTVMVVAILSIAAFGQADIPLLFLPVMAMAIATATLGLSGAAAALVIIATLGSLLTAAGTGPVSRFFPVTETQVLFFQLYLVALLISSMPLAFLLAQRGRDLAEIAETARLLETAERTAKVGHWRFSPLDNSARWSREALRICGYDEDAQPNLEDWFDLHHEDDRARVRSFIVEATSHALPFAFEARIRRTSGEIVHIDCRGEAEADAKGRVVALFGTIMDVSERAETMRQLEAARARAEREAAEVRNLAETDPLTGMPNRRCILANLAEAMDASEITGEPLSVAMIDIDHFKRVNDEFGHGVGDKVIKQVADILCDEAKDSDTVGRIGGEEFLFVFPRRRAGDLCVRCEAIKERILAADWEEPVEITLSIGVAELATGWDERDLMRAADRALYEAKRAGRNQHSVHQG
ncbi:sensor domain-containing diguanylate cyclase [Qipengyuania aquimaris]|uniref:sensor domain-containing diguanylate cyclase n=1 Tax=Qipengyuania aquimaris TaxID=255984 RepID=UPI001FD38E29|nr:sensor domain-containing diguanylate cyclase [Qipengyuania aquimaris]UOR15307.1 diguanylate cyclase [Qipengyuania aquimaris]